MSISPPSDIVLDVAQAADPSRLQAATAKLSRMATGVAAGSDNFSATLKTAEHATNSGKLASSTLGSAAAAQARSASLSPYQKFEAVVLQNFVQNILPKDDELFGDAASADMVRSMMAEQVSAQIARTGRLGIAKMIEAAHGLPGGPRPPAHEAAALGTSSSVAPPQRAAAASAPVEPQARSAPTELIPSGIRGPDRLTQ